MKYGIHFFEELNEEYRSKPIRNSFTPLDPDSLFRRSRSILARVKKLVPLEGKRVLEIGCGRGHLSSLLASEYNCSVVGVDVKEYAEVWELLKSKSPNLDYRVVDLSSENPFEAESFDLIVSFVVWEHIIHPFITLRECCKILKPSGAIYIYVNPYRSPTGSHRDKEIFFPFPHLLFEDEVFVEYYMKHTGKRMKPTRLNKLTYSHYKEYFRILNLRIEHEELRKVPLDKDFYNRFKDKLECYPIFDLELNAFGFLLRKDALVAEQSSVRKVLVDQTMLDSQLRAVKNSFSYRLGNMLVRAVCKPGRNTILLPYRLIQLARETLRRHVQP